MSNIRELSQLASVITVSDATKSVGIGSTQPSSKLSVEGNAYVSGVLTATSFIGDGSNLIGVSTFSGNYNDLTNTPTIPTNNNELTNGAGYITTSFTSTSQLTNDAGFITNNVSGVVTATSFSGDLTGDVTGNADTASALETSRTIALSGDVSGSTSFDGSANVTITATVADDSHNHVISNVDGLQTALDAKAPLASPALTGTPTAPTAAAGTNTTQVATTAFVSTAVANVIDSAPGALDTLNELAAALGDDANFSTTVTNSIAAKLPLSGGEMTGNITFSGSQTVDGRDLSVDGAKLDGIAAGAEVNVQSDWNATSGDAFILNKPTIPTNNNQLTNGAGYITATLTNEQVQDIVGGMLTGNTESGITVTYQDADGTIDFSVSSQTDNNFTTTLKNKLDGIESGATADQTASEILTAIKTVDGSGSGLDADLLDGQQGSYYLNTSTTFGGDVSGTYNAIVVADDSHNHIISNVDGLQTALDAKLSLSGGTMTGNIAFSGTQTVDGRDLSVDGAKLDGIESGATADQTAAEIRALVESATDSNVFTDADHTKLNGIESGATADQTASEILTAIKTVDGSGSGLDADTVDGIQASSFLRSDAADTATGTLTVRDIKLSAGYHLQRSDHHSGHLEGSYNNVGANSYKTNPIYTIGSSYNPNDADLNNMYGIGYSHTNASFINFTGASGWGMYVAADGDARIYLGGSNGVISSTGEHYVGSSKVWHAGNDGAGSGLDADTVDGYQTATANTANTIVLRDASGNFTAGTVTATNFNSTSDINKKTNLREVVDSLEILKGIRGVRFDWIEDGTASVGVVAQEIEQVLPELVTETDGTKTVNYNGLVGVLIEAVKELQAEVEELKKTR